MSEEKFNQQVNEYEDVLKSALLAIKNTFVEIDLENPNEVLPLLTALLNTKTHHHETSDCKKG